MIKKLRIKFIIISMVSILIVLSVIITGINISNYVSVSNQADSVLKQLFEAGGRFDNGEKPNGFPNKMSEEDFDNFTNKIDNNNPEMRFETRYFTVIINGDDNYEVFMDNIKAIETKEDAIKYAKTAINKSSKKGYIGIYRYLYGNIDNNTNNRSNKQTDNKSNSQMVIFMDCSKGLDNAKSFLQSSLLISFIGYVCVFVAIFFASKYIFKPVDEAYQKQKRFISNASHELKTPLTIISANNEISEMTYGENESSIAINKQVKRLNQMVSSLSLLTKLSEKNKLDNISDFNLSDALNDVIAESYILNDDSIKSEVKIEPDLNINGEEGLIRQLFSIIIDNMVKYSNTYINISAYKDNKNIILEFINDCYQIEDGNHPEVFERFYRNDIIRSKKEGSGIGLSIAKEIVELHKAEITASSVNNSFKIKIII